MDRIEVTIKVIMLNYKERDLVIWGICSQTYMLRDELMRRGFNRDITFVDNDITKINYKDVLPPDSLYMKSNDKYVVCPLMFHRDIEEKLVEYGYMWVNDYLYFESRFYHHELPKVLTDNDGYYEDNYGNIVVGNRDGIDIRYDGFGSRIEIGTDNIIEKCIVIMDMYANLRIGNRNRFGGGTVINCWENSNIEIGNGNTILTNFRINAEEDSKVIIGDDCLFSHNVILWTNDGHCIFDVETGECINYSSEERNKRNIIIGNHVWLGYDVNILYKTEIGDGSIVGLKSIVKMKVPNNVIVAGVPATIVRKNVAWSLDQTRNIEDCGLSYINLTECNG